MTVVHRAILLLLTFAIVGHPSALRAQDLVEYELNDTYKFKGYVKAYSLGALGIFYRNNKVWVVRVLYHPSEYGVAVEYKVPGWMPIEDYLKNKSNEICLEYVYLELMNRLRLPAEKGPIKTRLKKAMLSKPVRNLMLMNNTKVLWAYTHFADFRLDDGTTGTFPIKMFIGTPHEKQISADYLKEVTATTDEQMELALDEQRRATILQSNISSVLPMGAFGPSWMGLSPDSPRTWQLMKLQQNANYLFNKSTRRQRYLFLLQNAL
jgi:hypothetical protein